MADLIVIVTMLILGRVFGAMAERKHIKRLEAREYGLRRILMTNLKRIPEDRAITRCEVVAGEAVIALDYFKFFMASLRNIFGGEVRSYNTLIDRARREATVRMLEEAWGLGADQVWNIRYETSTIGGKAQGKPGGVEIMAYGTAVIRGVGRKVPTTSRD